MPAPHESFRERIVEASRRKYTVHVDTAKNLIAEEEAGILRSASEKGIIERKAKGSAASEGSASQSAPAVSSKEEPKDIEPLI